MSDEATQQPILNAQTKLALERTRVAYERTVMAWIRTSTSLITFGFGVYKFFQLELKIVGRENERIGVREFALWMVGAGVLAMILGSIDHWRNMRALRKQDPNLPRSLAGLLAAVIMCLGFLALVIVTSRR